MTTVAIAEWLASMPDQQLAESYPLFWQFKAAVLGRGKKKGKNPTELPAGGDINV